MEIDFFKMTKEELAESYFRISHQFEELKGEIDELKAAMFEKMEADSEVMGDYVVSKATRLSFKEITLEQADELGATKTAIDNAVLGKMYKKGVKLPIEPTKTEYIIIKHYETTKE